MKDANEPGNKGGAMSEMCAKCGKEMGHQICGAFNSGLDISEIRARAAVLESEKKLSPPQLPKEKS